ncbi:beta/gamma crystallin domain-containing protein [Streptomyces sp. DSM 15324]|uniref:beta/gamma crystallin domain-containing protein n=1 Tax=Streptomyces sp. DSM 15324 TaxID=1739111 RepID=UPI00099EDA73|nr:beta/gamma crystallin domain-containing protein [Streptomyces sp. DSM 15324]
MNRALKRMNVVAAAAVGIALATATQASAINYVDPSQCLSRDDLLMITHHGGGSPSNISCLANAGSLSGITIQQVNQVRTGNNVVQIWWSDGTSQIHQRWSTYNYNNRTITGITIR